MLTLYVEACKVFSFRVRCDDRTVKYQTPTNITHLLPMTSDPQSHLGAWARGLYRAVVAVEPASDQEHAGAGALETCPSRSRFPSSLLTSTLLSRMKALKSSPPRTGIDHR